MTDAPLPLTFGDSTLDDALDVSDYDQTVTANAVLYLTDLPAMLDAAGLAYLTWSGWQTRGRRSGSGYAQMPTGVIWHHTASDTSPANDVAFMAENAPYAPIANLYVARSGLIYVMAAGPCNHAGSGDGSSWGALYPPNTANTNTIGIECANNGVGQVWPTEQLDVMVRLGAAILSHYGITAHHHRAHYEYAPARKIDPAGPPAPYMLTGDSHRRWDMALFRADIVDAIGPPQGDTVITTENHHLVPPVRLLDSRDTGKLPDNSLLPVRSSARAAVLAVTVLDADAAGYLTFWPRGDRPEISHVNYRPGDQLENTAVTVPLNDAGDCFIFASAPVHCIVDLIEIRI